MSEHQKQAEFLKALIDFEDTEELRRLQARIQQAERDEKCIRMAMALVGFLALLSASGLCYSAVLLPEFFHREIPWLVKVFLALGLACMICMAVFAGYWVWYRGISNRVHHECRGFVMALLKAKLKDKPELAALVQNDPDILYHNGTILPSSPPFASLSKAS